MSSVSALLSLVLTIASQASAGAETPSPAEVGARGRWLSGFIQLGVNDSRTIIANRYFGSGLTGFGLVPGRPSDSFGAGFAWSGLNTRLGFRRDEALFQAYDQIKIKDAFYLEPAVTVGPIWAMQNLDSEISMQQSTNSATQSVATGRNAQIPVIRRRPAEPVKSDP
jgi:hypothetical protein